MNERQKEKIEAEKTHTKLNKARIGFFFSSTMIANCTHFIQTYTVDSIFKLTENDTELVQKEMEEHMKTLI